MNTSPVITTLFANVMGAVEKHQNRKICTAWHDKATRPGIVQYFESIR